MVLFPDNLIISLEKNFLKSAMPLGLLSNKTNFLGICTGPLCVSCGDSREQVDWSIPSVNIDLKF